MKVLCLSHPLASDTPLYGGKKQIEISRQKDMCAGDSSNSFRLSFPNHSSTHIDAPLHFIADGRSITDFAPEHWVFSTTALVEHTAAPGDLIDFDPCAKLHADAELLLIRTGFEKRRGSEEYWSQNPGLAPELAAKLREYCPRLRAVGVDFISVSSFMRRDEGRRAHREFLSRGLCLIEDMKLADFVAGPVLTVAAPLLAEGLDGTPVNVYCIYS